eukprot:gene6495-7524_t
MDTVPQAPLILITGGSRGVGAATARLAAAQGYDVAISFVSDESAALAVVADVEAAGRRALAVRADSADPEQSRVEDLPFERMQRIFAVNAIGPMLCAQQAVKRIGGEPGRVDRVKDSIPMGRGGQPEEVARAILWLAGAEASFITGTFLDVTGGK